MSYQPDEEAIRRRVTRRIRGRLIFFVQLMLAIPIMEWASHTPSFDYGARLVAFLWVVALVTHGCKRLYDWMVERGVRHEMERERNLYQNAVKPKNDFYRPARLRLTDDGELADSLDDGEEETAPKAKRQM